MSVNPPVYGTVTEHVLLGGDSRLDSLNDPYSFFSCTLIFPTLFQEQSKTIR